MSTRSLNLENPTEEEQNNSKTHNIKQYFQQVLKNAAPNSVLTNTVFQQISIVESNIAKECSVQSVVKMPIPAFNFKIQKLRHSRNQGQFEKQNRSLQGNRDLDLLTKAYTQDPENGDRHRKAAELESVKKCEAQELVRRLNVERLERQQRERERRKNFLEKLEKEIENEERAKFDIMMAEQRKHAEKILVYQHQKEKRLEEKKLNEEHIRKVHLRPERSYMHKQIEEQYFKNIVEPSVEFRKQELAKKRNLYKPFTRDNIESHARRIEELRLEREAQRKQDLIKKKQRDAALASEQQHLKTVFSSKIIEEEERLKNLEQQRQEERKLKKKKMEQYAELIRELSPLVPSVKKRKELENNIMQLKHPVRQKRDVKADYEIKKLNINRSHSHVSKKINSGLEFDKIEQSPGDIIPKFSANKVRRSLDPTRQSNPRSIHLFHRRQLENSSPIEITKSRPFRLPKSIRFDWQSDIKNLRLNPLERINKVVEKAELIEKQASLNEEIEKVLGGNIFDISQNASDMLVEAIKAKLAVLDKFC